MHKNGSQDGIYQTLALLVKIFFFNICNGTDFACFEVAFFFFFAVTVSFLSLVVLSYSEYCYSNF